MAMDPTQPTAPTNNPAQPAQVKPPMTPPGGIAPPTSFTPPQTPTSVPTLGPATTQAGTANMPAPVDGVPNGTPQGAGMGLPPVPDQNGNTTGLAPVSATAPIVNGQQVHAESGQGGDGWTKSYDAQGNFSGQKFDGHADAGNGPSTYSYAPGANGGQNVLQSQSLNGGPLTDPQGKPLAPGVNHYGETQQMGGGLAAQLKNPDGSPVANQATGGNGPSTPALGPAQGATSPTGAPAGTPTGVGISGINPGQPGGDLRGSQILPTDQVDRFKLAQDRYDTMSKASDPAYQASLRSATQRGAASGTMGSGMLNTDYGNLALQRGRDLETSKSNLLQNALEGSIGDSANNRAEYRGERGYQNALENQGYNRGVNALDQEDRLTNSQYGRSSRNYEAGQANNPADQYNLMANVYGRNAAGAAAGAGGYAQARETNRAASKYGHPLTDAIGTKPTPAIPSAMGQ